MKIKIKSHWLDKEHECRHIYGSWHTRDEGGLFYLQKDMIKDASDMRPDDSEDDGLFHCGDLDTIFRYCPICGKKLILSESENEVELIEEEI